jgi:hypothetical protein
MSHACQVALRSSSAARRLSAPTTTALQGPRLNGSKSSSVPQPSQVIPSTSTGRPPRAVTRSSWRNSPEPGRQLWSYQPRKRQESLLPTSSSCSIFSRAVVPSMVMFTSPSSVADPSRKPASNAGIGSRPLSRPTGVNSDGTCARACQRRAVARRSRCSSTRVRKVSAALAACPAATSREFHAVLDRFGYGQPAAPACAPAAASDPCPDPVSLIAP